MIKLAHDGLLAVVRVDSDDLVLVGGQDAAVVLDRDAAAELEQVTGANRVRLPEVRSIRTRLGPVSSLRTTRGLPSRPITMSLNSTLLLKPFRILTWSPVAVDLEDVALMVGDEHVAVRSRGNQVGGVVEAEGGESADLVADRVEPVDAVTVEDCHRMR